MSQLKGKSILITGGTGTVGQACVKEILKHYQDIGNVIIYSRDEIKQLEMMEEFPEEGEITISYLLGDVRDLERLIEVSEGVDYLIHAAAIKHVVMAEKNPAECWKTNVLGTKNVLEAAIKNGIQRSILISTDKAVNPLAAYGKSKLEAERLFKEADSENSSFGIVRMGNIIGARGSVFEAFEKQRRTGVIKVTHPEATRFCISQKEAAKFIVGALLTEVQGPLVPEMKTFRVLDLAKEIAPECEIEIVGLRPGDKLHEEIDGNYSSFRITALNPS